MNKSQRAFLKNVSKSIDQAFDMRDNIVKAMGVGVAHEKNCQDIVDLLNSYINAAQRTFFFIKMAYDSEGSEDIGFKKIAEQFHSRDSALN